MCISNMVISSGQKLTTLIYKHISVTVWVNYFRHLLLLAWIANTHENTHLVQKLVHPFGFWNMAQHYHQWKLLNFLPPFLFFVFLFMIIDKLHCCIVLRPASPLFLWEHSGDQPKPNLSQDNVLLERMVCCNASHEQTYISSWIHRQAHHFCDRKCVPSVVSWMKPHHKEDR